MGKEKSLRITFHGRIIDHLGIQMYQSPVAAIAELVSNAWDADAEEVDITLPESVSADAAIQIRDNGVGMTFAECESRYLNVGWCRRGDAPTEKSPGKHRPILGRKGIGKFAGFGIADVIEVETTSKQTGERTVFELNLDQLRGGGYVSPGGKIAASHSGPNPSRRNKHGTTISLRSLKLSRCPSVGQFRRSMARRFLLQQHAADFALKVNKEPVPKSPDMKGVEFVFPRDYRQAEQPEGVRIEGEWGIESVGGRQIKWRIWFYKETIEEEELRGVSVFANGKLAQSPFFFNLSGGLGGQHGQEYMSGQVQADYLDALDRDVIATERQRVRWEESESSLLLDWGQGRIKQLLRLWRDRRGEERRRQIEERVGGFSDRLEKLPTHERRTVKSALTKLGGVPTLSDEQFNGLCGAMLTAWEQGRLRGLIDEMATQVDFTSESMLSLLTEADVLVALNIAEAVRTKLEAIRGLRKLIRKGELENAVRDYIAEKPYLLHPKWETFKKETSVKHILDEAADEAQLNEEGGDYGRKRIDLALRSGEHLLVVEFIRPGKKADYDHLSRCKAYVHNVREKTELQTELGIRMVTGLVVADTLEASTAVRREIKDMRTHDIFAYEWESLLQESERTWKDFLELVGERAPDDDRLKSLQR
jgi:hypothetical protein